MARRRPAAAQLATALSLLAVASCGGMGRVVPKFERPQVTRDAAAQVPQENQAVVDTAGADDWIRLTSGEWLRGEVLYIDRETLAFDSTELDELHLDVADVAELRSERVFTVLFEDGTDAIGVVRVDPERLWLTTPDGASSVPRSAVTRLVPGVPREANYWSGKIKAGLTARSGNTDQTDTTGSIWLMRRTARSRLPIQLDAAYSELSGAETANNQRLHTQYDRFLTRRFYLTPLGVDALRDPFQNIAARVTPFSGLGYTLIDRSNLEWDADLGLGYRYIDYESVTAGEDATDEQFAGVVGTRVDWDVRSDLEVILQYKAEIGLDDPQNTNQITILTVSVDLFSDFDLDVTARWDRIGQPIADSNGNVPEKDDFRLTVGLGWSF